MKLAYNKQDNLISGWPAESVNKEDMESKNKRLRYAVFMLIGIVAFGTFGYYWVEHMPLFEAFYMTIITISTVGYAEIVPLSQTGRALTIVIIILGIGVGAYSISLLVRAFIEGELAKIVGRRIVQKQISDLKNHYIVCGFGRIGRIICNDLAADNIDFVVIEQDPAIIEHIESKNYLFLELDATSEEALLKAGIMKAKGIATALRSDANNVFITLTAKGLRPNIYILARASHENNEDKLSRAGASRVVSPHLIGGRRMAQVLKRPTVVDFIDIATMGSSLGLMMEEAMIGKNSDLINKNLIDSNLRKDFGVIIVAIKKLTGNMIFNPMPSETLEAGDVIVVIGKREDLQRMNAVM